MGAWIGQRQRILGLALLLGLGGCATAPQEPTGYEPVAPPEPAPIQTSAGGMYNPHEGLALFGDNKAHQVGDILTIILQEQTDATKSASTNTSKDTEIDTPNPTVMGVPLSLRLPRSFPGGQRDFTFENQVNNSQTFEGSGDSNQSNSLEGRITVTVAEVLANGNLVVRGQKRLSLNQGDEYIRFKGIVRPEDVDSDNTVPSNLVADAKMAYGGSGAVASANEMGWLSRFFNSKWWPF